MALGVQPIASREFGKHAMKNAVTAFKHGLRITIGLALVLMIGLIIFKRPVIDLFNTERQPQLLSYALVGMPIYFTSTIFTAINILIIIFLTAINQGSTSFQLSLLRGYVILIPLIVILALTIGVNGVFAAMPINEIIVMILGGIIMRSKLREMQGRSL